MSVAASLLGLLTSPSQSQKLGSSRGTIPIIYTQPQGQAGLLVTKELDKAIDRCRRKVNMIAADCRRRNRRFKDIEFDLQEDRDRCLNPLAQSEAYEPQDVLRVHQIFDAPSFYIDNASGNDLAQGQLGDCWFISALAAVSTKSGLMEKICVARDEQVGVYGFIFYRDNGWTDIVIDDYLLTSIPKYEELNDKDRNLYKYDKDMYNKLARKGSKTLYFAKSGTENETWVPLIEKAYAKLHGDYGSLAGGFTSEAIEDMTGGVATQLYVANILDEDRFWKEELLKVNEDRLFSCFILPLSDTSPGTTVEGLIPYHEYSILAALKVKGKRFLKIKNPWGNSEWAGRWSDGSKDWTTEWLQALPELQHTFGNDGQFLMEYKDFLVTWAYVCRTQLFDSSWMMSSHWLNVKVRPFHCAWSFGDISFTFSIPESTPAVVVVSQVDERCFRSISGGYIYSIDFVIYKRGEAEPLTSSSRDRMQLSRSANTEVELESGEYIVHVRIDMLPRSLPVRTGWDERKLARTETERLISQKVASNFDMKAAGNKLPLDIEILAGRDVTELELVSGQLENKEIARIEQKRADTKLGETEAAVTVKTASKQVFKGTKAAVKPTAPEPDDPEPAPMPFVHEGYLCDECNTTPIVGPRFRCMHPDCVNFDLCENCVNLNIHPASHHMHSINGPDSGSESGEIADKGQSADQGKKAMDTSPEDDSSVTIGLRVYTKRHAPAEIKGQLRHGDITQSSMNSKEP